MLLAHASGHKVVVASSSGMRGRPARRQVYIDGVGPKSLAAANLRLVDETPGDAGLPSARVPSLLRPGVRVAVGDSRGMLAAAEPCTVVLGEERVVVDAADVSPVLAVQQLEDGRGHGLVAACNIERGERLLSDHCE